NSFGSWPSSGPGSAARSAGAAFRRLRLIALVASGRKGDVRHAREAGRSRTHGTPPFRATGMVRTRPTGRGFAAGYGLLSPLPVGSPGAGGAPGPLPSFGTIGAPGRGTRGA